VLLAAERFPAPRSSKSSAATRNPAPRALNSLSAASRRVASGVSDTSSGPAGTRRRAGWKPDASAKLIQLGKSKRSARLMRIVLARGISSPFSTMVVEIRTSASSLSRIQHHGFQSFSFIWRAPRQRAFGTSLFTRAAIEYMDSTRLWTRNTWPSRASSSSIARRTRDS